ncbi:MAG: FAD-dependent oxidoreductase, partial [Acidobacteriota bacterium]|nr:FAD-dependent oxidoreductase [Acidobacteriota bacterium]
MRKKLDSDVAIVGAGVAGLTAALTAADAGASVLLVAKGAVDSSNSWAAQGGVAAAVGPDDDPSLHAADTLAAGRGLCRASAVRLLTDEAPARIAALVALGVRFDEGLGREGGHARSRVVHAGGAETGRRIAEVLAARARTHPRIRIEERRVGAAGSLPARAAILATGGYAALWERTTNPRGATGEGLLLAHAAGAALADLEMVQFHPTALLDDGFLLSEALRGAGATLLDDDGERFTDELAPRDVVARAIAARDGASLDLRAIERDRYPTLMATLERAGYDPAAEPIPVSPAAHYAIGGIVTDLDGRTSVPGLYAAGECACTGVHGANRLASNSLLECLVFGRRAALAALEGPPLAGDGPPPSRGQADGAALWRHAGLMRNADGLSHLLDSPNELVRLVARSALAR